MSVRGENVLILVLAVTIFYGAAWGAPASGGAMHKHNENGAVEISENEVIRGRWEIMVPGGAWREFIYTNKNATHFSGESVRRNSRSYHGLFCAMHEYLDSWELTLGDRLVAPDEKTQALAYPHVLYRRYPDTGVLEEIVLPDNENGVVVRYHNARADGCALVPWFDMRFIWDVPRPEYRIFWERKNNVLLVSRVDDPFPPGRPRWCAVTADVSLDFETREQFRTTDYPKDAARRAMGRTHPFSPGSFHFIMPDAKEGTVTFAFGLGVTEDEAVSQAKRFVQNLDRFKREKLHRIEQLLEKAPAPARDARFDKALRWARVSMDNLVMNQRGRGIYAGFHWFPNYWGRDSFICLPGACLATGELDTAREILLSFMEHQQVDRSDPRLGRFPNIVNPEDLQYGGVDGTWWLVRAAWKYYIASGDRTFLVEAFPRIKLAIDGAEGKASDGKGFLVHGNGETWMDAGGERNPYTPRGNRAVEVQALYHHGLRVGAAWARELARGRAGESSPGADTAEERFDIDKLEAFAGRCENQAGMLSENFRHDFWNEAEGYLYDHLDPDGTPDIQIRPNAVLALWVSLDAADFAERGAAARDGAGPLIGSAEAARIVETALRTVVLPQGVTSLYPRDPHFHPHHLALDRYYFDEAYHNGDVWEWLTGPMVSCLIAVGEGEKAWRLLSPLVDEILDEACVGSLREIRDGAVTPGREEFGGATSQAWSLAEFIRVCLTVLPAG
jgi:glycogen debranching enzyme